MTALAPSERSKLVKVLAMLGSNHDGERAAAGLLATRILQSAGASWDELLQPRNHCAGSTSPGRPPSPVTEVGLCCRHLQQLSEWERSFVLNLRGRVLLTLAQRRKLTQITARLRKAGAA